MRDTSEHADMSSELMQNKGMTGLQIFVMHTLSELVPQQHAAIPVQILQCCSLASTTQNCAAHLVSAFMNTRQSTHETIGKGNKGLIKTKSNLL